MKASEALMLGMTMLSPLRGIKRATVDGIESGCALGMIGAAGGYAIGKYPKWMSTARVCLPCSCGTPFKYGVDSAIVHLFDDHVRCKHAADTAAYTAIVTPTVEPWTIEQIADWLRTVEPQEQENHEENQVESKTESESKESSGQEVGQAVA